MLGVEMTGPGISEDEMKKANGMDKRRKNSW